MISNSQKNIAASGANALVLKDFNTRLIRQALKNARTATVRDLSAITGLSLMTVSTIVQNLVASGTARETALIPSSGGRPSRLYRFDETQSLVMVLYFHEEQSRNIVSIRVADLYGAVIDSEDYPLGEVSLEAFEPPMDRFLSRYPAIRAIGFGIPGIEYGGSIVTLDYRELVGADLVGHFGEKYGLPVIVENDVNAAVLGRGLRENAAETEVYLFFPRNYPPGSGIRIGGQLIKGFRNFAGEISWLPLGIAWGTPAVTESFAASTDAISKVIVSLAAIVNPESAVLFGEFLGDAHRDAIRALCESRLPAGMCPDIVLTEDFPSDFESGLVSLTLNRIEPAP